MSLHGNISVNGYTIGRWYAIRKPDQPDERPAIYEWGYEDVSNMEAVAFRGEVEHLRSDGAELLVSNVMLAKRIAMLHRKGAVNGL